LTKETGNGHAQWGGQTNKKKEPEQAEEKQIENEKKKGLMVAGAAFISFRDR